MYNNYEITGKSIIYIKAINNSSMNGVDYLAGEVIAGLDNCLIDIKYEANNKNSVAKTIKMATQDIKPTSISIRPESLNSSIYNLLGVKIESSSYLSTARQVASGDINGHVFLNEIPDPSAPIFIYNSLRNAQVVDLDTDDNKLIGLVDGEEYTVYYSVSKNITEAFSLRTTHLPYVELEIIATGNINGSSNMMTIKVPKASLMVAPIISLDNEKMNILDLEFLIIDAIVEVYYR